MDYRQYSLRMKERLVCLLISGGISGGIAWLFYRSAWGLLLFPAVYALCGKRYRDGQLRRRKERLLLEFKDAMQSVSAALLAGYAVENAWREAEREMRELHGESSLLVAELAQINAAVRMNEPLERLLAEFAARSGCEEIESFAEVFLFARRGGGDFANLIRLTVDKISGRMDVEREINTVLSGRKLEGRIMNVMPAAILAYLSISSGDFLEVLYGNSFGVLVMSGALVMYALAMKLSEHILDIQV